MRAMITLLFGSSNAALTATASPDSATGFAVLEDGRATAVTNTVIATANGGIGPYSYAWEQLSGDAVTIGYFSPDAVFWTISDTFTTRSESVWRCVVTDALGALTATGDVSVYLEISN